MHILGASIPAAATGPVWLQWAQGRRGGEGGFFFSWIVRGHCKDSVLLLKCDRRILGKCWHKATWSSIGFKYIPWAALHRICYGRARVKAARPTKKCEGIWGLWGDGHTGNRDVRFNMYFGVREENNVFTGWTWCKEQAEKSRMILGLLSLSNGVNGGPCS